MSDIAIRVEGLSKQFRIGAPERYRTLRDTLADGLTAPFRRLRNGSCHNNEAETIWALKEVSFEVKHGEVIGIIGRNGAGKSTLLKILSRITEPTGGRGEIHGRVGSLLEVGTGFHPELTGRENIFLNGAILGMKKAEIRCKFDEIVAFAGTERFLDTPVKHYSSGMYVRLAFGVAVHLPAEILIVDEVLAVGDAEFQRKCLMKMQHVAQGGRTIVFVSHNIAAVRQICQRAIALDGGRLVDDGDTNRIADAYVARAWDPSSVEGTLETESFLLAGVSVKSSNGPVIKPFDRVEILVDIKPKVHIRHPGLYIGILTSDGTRIAGLDLTDFETPDPISAGEVIQLGMVIEELPLLPGIYFLELHLKEMSSWRVEFVPERFPFEIVEGPVYGGRKIDGWFGMVGLRAYSSSSRLVSDR